MDGELKTRIKVTTGGNGLWSNVAKDVVVNRIVWDGNDDGETFVKLYLDGRTWSQKKDGLIYTDETFKKNMRKILTKLQSKGELPDLPWEDLDYTEQGMQGGHCFVCPDDCKSCKLYVHMILGSW